MLSFKHACRMAWLSEEVTFQQTSSSLVQEEKTGRNPNIERKQHPNIESEGLV